MKECPNCIKYQSQKVELLISTQLPSLHGKTLAQTCLNRNQVTYLLIIDHYSCWIEIAKLTRLTANSVINHTKSIFARHGIPEQVISDKGLQFSAGAYARFAEEYSFKHVTSSPHHLQGNGEAKRGPAQTIKNLLK